jgi:protein SCO1/2
MLKSPTAARAACSAHTMHFNKCDKTKREDGLSFLIQFTPEWISVDSPEYSKIHTIPDFSPIKTVK